MRATGRMAQPLSVDIGLNKIQQKQEAKLLIIRPDISNDLLEEGQNQKDELNEVSLSEIKIKVANETIRTLLDTGSEVSVISERVLDTLKENEGVIFPTLPVAGVTVVGVTGVRSKRINRQVLLQFEMGEQLFKHTFLVIKGLNFDLILGSDFFE